MTRSSSGRKEESAAPGLSTFPGKRTLLAILILAGTLWFGAAACSDSDFNFPGNIPASATPRPTAEPTATPDDDPF
jgi:hypothetical protein